MNSFFVGEGVKNSGNQKILMLTGHIYSSKRKAGFHHLAKALINKNYQITFCTVPNSTLDLFDSLIKVLFQNKDMYLIKNRISSFTYSIFPKKEGNLIETSYVSLVSNIHKSKSKLKCVYTLDNIINIDTVLKKIFLCGFSKMFLQEYDIIIFESTNGLLLFETLKRKNPNATFIYRVSDDLEMVNGIQEIIQYEKKILSKFNLVSCPSRQIAEKLQSKSPMAKIIIQYHGIEKALFDRNYSNPYFGNSKNLVFVGTGFMDETFLKIVSELNQNWTFHIIGNLPQPIKNNNIKYYGEMPFNETIPYLKHADCGLQILTYSKGIEVFERTLKYIQYTYLKLPIIAPKYMNLKDKHVFPYEYTKASIENTIINALEYDRDLIQINDLQTWEEIAEVMILDALSKN